LPRHICICKGEQRIFSIDQKINIPRIADICPQIKQQKYAKMGKDVVNQAGNGQNMQFLCPEIAIKSQKWS